MIHSLHHLAIIASSEASIAFYEKLGFCEYKRIKRNYDTVVLMKGPGFELELFVDPNHTHKTDEPYGLRHLALKVDNIEGTVKELGLESPRSATTGWASDTPISTTPTACPSNYTNNLRKEK
jgi:glyoxylase I family protein